MEVDTISIDDPEVVGLVELHLRGMSENSPAESVFALDLSGLSSSNVTLFGAYLNEVLVGIGALNALSNDHGEIKSMRTKPDALRKGVGASVLEAIINEASRRGYRTLSLETGSGPAFDAALKLYQKRGFVLGSAFGAYKASDFNQFYYLALT
jgi:putative acetyltransferase